MMRVNNFTMLSTERPIESVIKMRPLISPFHFAFPNQVASSFSYVDWTTTATTTRTNRRLHLRRATTTRRSCKAARSISCWISRRSRGMTRPLQGAVLTGSSSGSCCCSCILCTRSTIAVSYTHLTLPTKA